jgi:hypothetical protein
MPVVMNGQGIFSLMLRPSEPFFCRRPFMRKAMQRKLSQKSISSQHFIDIMKLGAALFALAVVVLPSIVSGVPGHVVVLNGNKDEPPAVTCTATERIAIGNAIQAAVTARRRRQLSKGSPVVRSAVVSAQEETLELPHGRKLTCPTGCGPACWIGGTGCPGGMGRRDRRRRAKESKAAARRHVRQTREQQPDHRPEERQVLVQPDSTGGGGGGGEGSSSGAANPGFMTPLPMTMAACQAKIPAIHAALDTLQPSLTAPCQALLSAPRDITCQEFTTDCDVGLVKLVNADENSIVSGSVSASGTAFCQSDGISFEAATKFSVGLVHFVVSTPGSTSIVYNRTATEPPYYFNGETELGEPKGVNFPLGTYTMKITSDYDPLHAKTFAFTVNNC